MELDWPEGVPRMRWGARLDLIEPYLAGQQTGSKRLKSASLNHAESNREKPEKPHE
jgi:hypothetical protein